MIRFARATHFATVSCSGGLYGDAVSHSDFQLNIKPPGRCGLILVVGNVLALLTEEALKDVEASLDALLKVGPCRMHANNVVWYPTDLVGRI